MRRRITRGFWAEQFLLGLGAPLNNHTVYAILAQMAGENTKARNNPLATTHSAHVVGESDFNAAGVKNFPTFCAGMAASLETISRPPYDAVRAAIHRGVSAHDIVAAIEASSWGTHNIPLAAVIADPARYARKMVPS